jgi:endoglucanase
VLPRTFTLRAVALLAALALGAVGLVAPVDAQVEHVAAKHGKDPRKRLGLFVDPKMPAYQQGGVYRTRIGKYAQSFWVIPEAYDTSYVKAKVQEYTGDAGTARKTPVLTIYGIPGRDCGQYSSGNPLKTAAQYRAWIKQVAAGLRGTHPLVILEPDALALFSSSVQTCPTKPSGWKGMLRYASRKLSGTGAWVYLDAGHSNWTPYDDRPSYLKAAGVKYDRGISTNVSNFRPLGAEKAYAAKMLAGLRKLGVKGKHYVVDTSRNGATPPDGSGYDVINPTWARIGGRPKLVFNGAFDGTLWVKHPGESDGQVNGGGPSGQWCDMLADRLLRGTSDQSSCP